MSKQQLDDFKSNASHQKVWKGNRVIAIDGSLLNLPHSEDVETEFGGVTNQHEMIIRGRCSFAYDVCNELVIDPIIAPRRSCEKDSAVSHLTSLTPSTDVLVFDRGYPSQWLMGLLMKRKFKFCFRLSTAWKDAYRQLQGVENDIDWSMIRRSKKDLGKLRTYNLPISLEGLRLVSIELSSGSQKYWSLTWSEKSIVLMT